VKTDRRWLVPLLLVSALLMMGAEEDGCAGDTSTDGGGGEKPGQAAKAKPTPDEPDLTAGQENALQSAQDYVDLAGFSKAGLLDQLTSSAGEGYPRADATYAVNHVDADWNAEAVEAAQDYLDISSFSKEGLIDQLSSSAGDKFTPAQAQYAADQVYK
jgi:hypothetical protein